MKMYELTWYWLGIWYLPSHSRWYTVYSVFANFSVLIMFNLGLVLSVLVADNMDEIIKSLMFALTSVTLIIKAIIFVASGQNIRQLIDLMKRLEAVSVNSPKERSILIATQRKGALATQILTSGAIVVVAMIFLNIFFQPKRALMFPALYPIDWQTNNFCYLLAMSYQVICTIFISTMVIAVDMWRTTAIFLLAGFLDIFRGRMQTLGWSKVEHLEEGQLISVRTNQNRIHEKKLRDCIKYHLLCLKYIQNPIINISLLYRILPFRYFRVLENSCKLHYFVQFSTSSLLVCATSFMITLVR